MGFNAIFTRMANAVSHWAGQPFIFIAACAIVVIWAVSGPVFHYSDTWQLVINTATTIITFLMVFLIQNTQNRDNAALHSKLDELILTSKAHNKFIGIETLPEEEIAELHEACEAEAEQTAETVATEIVEEEKKPGKRATAAERR
jgi:low affinity Fe/Cu permease